MNTNNMDSILSKVIKAIEYHLEVSLEEDIIEGIKSQLEELGYTQAEFEPQDVNIHGVYSVMEIYCLMITGDRYDMYRELTADQKIIYHIMEEQPIYDIYRKREEHSGRVCYNIIEFEYDGDKYIVELE